MRRFLLLFVFVNFLYAGGSGYSRYGVGDIRFLGSGRTDALGLLGIALYGGGFINRYNPASWSEIFNVRFSGVYVYEGISATDGVSSAFLTNGNFGGALMAFPVWHRFGLTLTAGILPFSLVNYSVKVQGEVNSKRYFQYYTGDGGISRIIFGFSFRPFKKLSFGFMGSYYFGVIKNEWKTDFIDNELFVDSEFSRHRSFSGAGLTGGLLFRTGRGKGSFSVGLIFSTPVDFNVSSKISYKVPGFAETGGNLKVKARFPEAFGFGLGYFAGKRYFVAGDFYFQKWGKYTYGGFHPDKLKNQFRVGFGVERLPSADVTSGFWDRTSYRVGFFYNSTYFKFRDVSIDEMFLTFGAGFPISFDLRLNLAFQYGVRGKTKNGLLQDKVFRVILSISAGEIWFVRRNIEED